LSQYTFYIDEAGDEGIESGGTRWFIIGGILVRREHDLAVSRTVNEVKDAIRQREPRQPLHWSDLKRSHQKRLYLVERFAKDPIRLVVAAIHKPSLANKPRHPDKQWLYNFVTKHLLERVSWLVRDETEEKSKVDLVFENRSNLSYESLCNYVETVIKPDPEVCDAVLGNITLRAKDQSKNLQIADACVGACFAALEPNEFGMTDDSYVQRLRPVFYRQGGSLMGYGLKLLPFDFATDGQSGLAWLEGL
jgi:hypothetical protein